MTERETTLPRPITDEDPHGRRGSMDPLFGVRTADIEPYLGLRYLSKLFRLIALILVLLLVAEVVTGLAQQGREAIPTLVAEASRLIVLAALLWGIGDLVLLLIDVGHDVRAARILIGRQVAHLHAGEPMPPAREPRPDRVDRVDRVERLERVEPLAGEEVGARVPPSERRS